MHVESRSAKERFQRRIGKLSTQGPASSLIGEMSRFDSLRPVWRRIPLYGFVSVELPAGPVRMFAHPSDVRIRDWHWKTWRVDEFETLPVFSKLASQANHVVDVGANQGMFTLTALKAGAKRVTAYEPVPSTAQVLAANIYENGWHDRAQLVWGAVSDADGLVEISIPRHPFPASASIARRASANVPVVVPKVTLDTTLTGPDPDLMKIDAEGAEEWVLKGATQTLKSRPTLILEVVVEHGSGLRTILSDHDYTLYHLTPAGPVRTDTLRPEASGKFRNYLCLPPGRVLPD